MIDEKIARINIESQERFFARISQPDKPCQSSQLMEKAITEIMERESKGNMKPMGPSERSRIALNYVELHRKVDAKIPVEVDYYKFNKSSKQEIFLKR
jgi:hypothetical protein